MSSGLNNWKISSRLAIFGAVLAAWSTSSAAMKEGVAMMAIPSEPIGVCHGGNRAGRHATCIYDGDTGWERGIKWRLLAIDAPELSGAQCQRELSIGLRSRDRLIQLMGGGYAIHWTDKQDRKGKRGRQLVSIKLADGRDAGQILMQEGIAQPWPNVGNMWCGTR
jgi:endonuclease YncB( thermonuclease family)